MISVMDRTSDRLLCRFIGPSICGFMLALIAVLPFSAMPALAQEKLISERVFLVPDAKSTSIQFQMIVLAGSADETNMDQLGIAHYLEHLVLVGRNPGESDTAQRFFADGNSNGWTNQRMTGYVHSFPASSADAPQRLDRLFRFYSERLTDFAIAPEEAVPVGELVVNAIAVGEIVAKQRRRQRQKIIGGLPLQIDVAFGDAIVPGTIDFNYPAMLDGKTPRIRAYPIETVFSEKDG